MPDLVELQEKFILEYDDIEDNIKIENGLHKVYNVSIALNAFLINATYHSMLTSSNEVQTFSIITIANTISILTNAFIRNTMNERSYDTLKSLLDNIEKLEKLKTNIPFKKFLEKQEIKIGEYILKLSFGDFKLFRDINIGASITSLFLAIQSFEALNDKSLIPFILSTISTIYFAGSAALNHLYAKEEKENISTIKIH